MNEVTAQIILAARNEDIDGWVNILVIVILAVFWAIGGIIKARAKKPEEQGEEELSRSPTRKRPQAGKGLKAAFLRQPHARPAGPAQRKETVRPRTVGQRVTAKKKPVHISDMEVPEEPKLSPLTTEFQPVMEELPEISSEPITELKDIYAGISAEERAKVEFPIESLLDYTDPDELRRAILHYEILGKPLSLRGPSEYVIGL